MKQVTEIEALTQIDNALSGLADDSARERVLRWAADKYAQNLESAVRPVTEMTGPAHHAGAIPPQAVASQNEISGVAKRVGDELRITVRDLKANSTNDAAIRLAHIAVRASELMSGEPVASSRKTVVPILKKWRCYTANTRKALAAQKGILREGDLLSLDEHARRDADRYIAEALDPQIEGSWNPSSASSKQSRKSKKKADKAV